MFGECHAHIFMDAINYKNAVAEHKNAVQESVIRKRFQIYRDHQVTYIRDGGDYLGVSKRAKEIAGEYGITYRTPIFAIHKNGYYGGIVGLGFDTMTEYAALVKKAKDEGADFIKIMTTGIMDFQYDDVITGESLPFDEVKEMIHIAHEEGMAVMSHTNGTQAVEDVIQAEVDSLEHGNYIGTEALCMLAESKTVWVPTIVTIKNLLGSGRFDDSVIERILHKAEGNIALAYDLGANLALGSDAGAYRVPHGQGIADEYAAFHEILGEEVAVDDWLRAGEQKIQQIFCRS